MTNDNRDRNQLLSSAAERNFVIRIRNPKTLYLYRGLLKRFLEYNKVKTYDELLFDGNTRLIQERVETFLYHIQNPDYHLSYATISHYLIAIKFFYTMNDILDINWRKISRILPSPRKKAQDRPYSRDEIARLLESVDLRGRVVILLMCSSGMRQGGIVSLKLAHLERLSDIDSGIYKITVYKNDPEEYFTFCSPECTKAIDDYLSYRTRCGEIIKSSAPLIRQTFNKIDPIDSANPRPLGVGSIENIIYRAINDSGLREKKNVVKGQPIHLHDVMQSHGLRKFWNTQVITAGMSVLYAEILMGHKSGLAMQSYVKPSVSQLAAEYVKVVDSVTIDEQYRLRKENIALKQKKLQTDKMLEDMQKRFDKIERRLGFD